ncbi:unnamed protein product [Sphagnum balticum]
MASMAEPKDPSNPMLKEWTKYKQNPILRPPPPVFIRDFGDPTTAWKGPNGVWRLAVGSKIGRAGVAMLYKSKDLYNWEYQGEHHLLHAVAGIGMWECVDFYPIGPLGEPAPDISAHGLGVKHVMKVSLDDERHDWYALDHYDTYKDIFVLDNPLIDVGIGLRYNYGKFYASKSFIDPVKQRRIIWGFVNESDLEVYDLAKGWNTVLGIPRTVWYDNYTNANIIQLPVDEINELRGSKLSKKAIYLAPGSIVPVEGAIGDHLDIEIVFDYPNVSKVGDKERNLDEHFEGSLARGIDTTIYGSFVNVLESEDFLSARIFVSPALSNLLMVQKNMGIIISTLFVYV